MMDKVCELFRGPQVEFDRCGVKGGRGGLDSAPRISAGNRPPTQRGWLASLGRGGPGRGGSVGAVPRCKV